MILRIVALLISSSLTLLTAQENAINNDIEKAENKENKKEIVEVNTKELKEKDIKVEEKPTQKSIVTQKDNEAKKLLEKYMKSSDIDIDEFAKVTLKDAVLESLSYSENIKAQREKVVQAQLNVDDAMADFYPKLDAEYNYEKTRTTPSGVEDQKYSKVTDEDYSLTFRQNIFNGGQSSAQLENKKYLLELEKNKYRIMLSQEISKAVKAYFDVVFNKKSVEVNERNMKLLEKILEIVTIKYESGALSLGDMTAIKAGVANAKSKLLKVKSSLAESLRYYEYIVGIKFKKTLPFEKDFNISVGDFDSLYDRALNTNPNLKNYYYNIKAQKYKVKQMQRKFAPRVDFEAGYEKVLDGFGTEDEPFIETENTTAGFKVTYNLYNGGKDKNGVLRSYSSLRHMQYNLEEEKKKLKWNLSKLHTSVQTVKDVLQSTFSEVKSSRTTVQSYWEGFRLGEQDLQVLLQGQRQLNAAELEYVKFQSSMVKDFFKILEYTGDLLIYFDVDPDNRKFIDFTNSKYMYEDTVVAQATVEADSLEDTLKESEKIVIDKVNTLNSLLEFSTKFMAADPEGFTILVEDFKQLYDALNFAKSNKINDEYLIFDTLEDNFQVTNIAHGIFKTQDDAKNKINSLNNQDKVRIEKIGIIQELYTKYLEGLKVDLPEPQVKIVEKVIKKTIPVVKVKTPVIYESDPEFKKEFLEAKSSQYTINIASFRTMKEAVLFTRDNEIYEQSFVFAYGSAKLVKVVYSLYDTYGFAYDDLNTKLKQLKMKFNPIIETVGTNQKLYEENIDLNIIEEPEYEFGQHRAKQQEQIEEKTTIEQETKKSIIPQEEVMQVKEPQNINEEIEEEEMFLQKEQPLESQNNEPVIEDEEKVEIAQEKGSFEEQFMNAPKTHYTLCLASLPNPNKVQQFISENSIENNSIIVPTTSGFKVYYKIFDSRNKAIEALNNLESRLKNNQPYINKISSVQTLYKKNKQKNQESNTIVEPVEKQSIEEEKTKDLFEVIFLKAPQSYYTICLSSLPNITKAEKFIAENKIDEQSIIIPTRSGGKMIYYGVYDSKENALEALNSLSSQLAKNKPYINKVSKPQSLYERYTKELNDE